jgi:hypothetical protein
MRSSVVIGVERRRKKMKKREKRRKKEWNGRMP